MRALNPARIGPLANRYVLPTKIIALIHADEIAFDTSPLPATLINSAAAGPTINRLGDTKGWFSGKFGANQLHYENSNSGIVTATPITIAGDFGLDFWFTSRGNDTYPFLFDISNDGTPSSPVRLWGQIIYQSGGTTDTVAVAFYRKRTTDSVYAQLFQTQDFSVDKSGAYQHMVLERRSGAWAVGFQGNPLTIASGSTADTTTYTGRLTFGCNVVSGSPTDNYLGDFDEICIRNGEPSTISMPYTVPTAAYTPTSPRIPAAGAPPAAIALSSISAVSPDTGVTTLTGIPAGAFVVVTLSQYQSNLTAMTGSTGGAYTRAVKYASDGTNTAEIWYRANHPGGNETITPTGDGGGFNSGVAMAFTGVATSNPVDKTATGGLVNSNSMSLSAGAANANAVSLEIGVATSYAGNNDNAWAITSSGWNLAGKYNDSNAHTGFITAYKIASAVETALYSVSSAGAIANGAIATFKPN